MVESDDLTTPLYRSECASARVRINGKYFSCRGEKWYAKGLVYGPFEPNSSGEHLPERVVVERDFEIMQRLGANTIRVYHIPPRWLLDAACEFDLHVFVDIPWEKHRCFFEDVRGAREARSQVRLAARRLGDHEHTLAFSVVNEIPIDVVRFYGRAKIERFVDELLDTAKQEAPDCLMTYANYPTTEFLEPQGGDFLSYNVYLDEADRFEGYVTRLQHIAGNRPVMLGEVGADSMALGEQEQAKRVRDQLERAYRRGLAGAVVFSFTDDWFTGGYQINDWAFGATRQDRTLKPLADELKAAWDSLPCLDIDRFPHVSAVVCTYNGSKTIRECLLSLRRLHYPSYDIHVIDDGSKDETASIVAEFPEVRYTRQENRGLSAARNLGAELAESEIIAYTDDDCVVEQDWLNHLVQGFADSDVAAVGGPNITPETDGWSAKCVARCPGNPSHVMLDDQFAEHVPGCNMAFWRSELLEIGGFDRQFRQAGDDVDIFWRLIDRGKRIGFSPGAMVWHHRRESLGAFLKQQRGYGRAEARLQRKHPHRSNVAGSSVWHGIIYGDRQHGNIGVGDIIYHGRFGCAPFQLRMHRKGGYHWHWPLGVEWHAVSIGLVLLGMLYPPAWYLAGLMWIGTLASAIKLAAGRTFPTSAPWWCRPLLIALFILQPIVRRSTRLWNLVGLQKMPDYDNLTTPACVHRQSSREWDLYWRSQGGPGRMELLEDITNRAHEDGWAGNYASEWSEVDMTLPGDLWHNITLRTATEELGEDRRFTRARFRLHFTVFTGLVAVLFALVIALAWLYLKPLPMALCVLAGLGVVVALQRSRRRCLTVITYLASVSGDNVGLIPVSADNASDDERMSCELAPDEA